MSTSVKLNIKLSYQILYYRHLAVVEAAKYCRQLIARTDQNGLRENIPSKFEVHEELSVQLYLLCIHTSYLLLCLVLSTTPQ